MRGALKRRPSPAMVVALAALIVAVTGTAIATPIAIMSLKKKEKRVIRMIAGNKANQAIDQRAPGLFVGGANTAGVANTANNANALSGVSLGNLVPVGQASDAECLTTGPEDCTALNLTLNRTADVLVIVTGTWHSDLADGTANRADCRIQRNDANVSGLYRYGSRSDDTEAFSYERAISMTQLVTDLAPGTHRFELECSVDEGDFDLSFVETTAIALGS